MDSFELNKIIGAILGTCLGVLTINIAAGAIFAPVQPAKPGYDIAQGRVVYKGEDLSGLAPEERARKGIFLAFQNPTEIPGVSVVNFLRTAYNSSKPDQQLGAMVRLQRHRPGRIPAVLADGNTDANP